ncbi:MAG: PKD domain-containing protein [Solirubrobacterales bacterium]|nr:PKD domain-containing protein [Solirubrobacterales bacterium]
MRRRLATLAVLTAALSPAAPAHAGFFPGDPIDGPSADVRSLGDLDVARDGSGAVAYLRRDGGADHVFVSRVVNGSFQPPERVDAGLDAPSAQPVVAASDGGRVVIVYINAGNAWATVWAAGAPGWSTPQQLAAGASASSPSVYMSINGVAYTTFTTGGDVRAARLDRGQTQFQLLGAPLDIDPGADAGGGNSRSRVAVSADGTALAVWGEGGHVVARRLFNLNLSAAPQDLTLPSLEDRPGGNADLPDVDIEDDSSFAWVTFRQQFTDGGRTQTRALARRLRGSRFEDATVVDGQAWGADGVDTLDVELNGRGDGLASAGLAGTGAANVAILKRDVFNPGSTVGGGEGVAPAPVGTISETLDRVVGWIQGPASTATVQARFFDDKAAASTLPVPSAPAALSNPGFGAVVPTGGLDVAANRAGDVLLVFLQENEEGRRLVAATYDRPPGAFSGNTTTRWRGYARPPLAWGQAFELWGPLTYRVEVDGVAVGETQDTKLTPLNPVADGEHRWRVVATDRRGQTAATKTRLLRVDATPPTLEFTVKRRKGRVAELSITAGDVIPPSGKASGLKTLKADFGDGTGNQLLKAKKASHRYGRGGTYTIRVSATDRAGNAVALTERVRIKRK